MLSFILVWATLIALWNAGNLFISILFTLSSFYLMPGSYCLLSFSDLYLFSLCFSNREACFSNTFQILFFRAFHCEKGMITESGSIKKIYFYLYLFPNCRRLVLKLMDTLLYFIVSSLGIQMLLNSQAHSCCIILHQDHPPTNNDMETVKS